MKASSEIDAMDVENIDLDNELYQIKKEINYYKSKLQNCRDKYERVEIEIHNVKQSQYKALFTLDNMQMEELHERLRNIYVNYEACVEKSGGYEDLNRTVHAKISELTTQRGTLMKELTQLRRNADDNGKKLARVKSMITEQEEKNAILLRELKKKSENITLIPENTRKRIDDVLGHLKMN